MAMEDSGASTPTVNRSWMEHFRPYFGYRVAFLQQNLTISELPELRTAAGRTLSPPSEHSMEQARHILDATRVSSIVEVLDWWRMNMLTYMKASFE
ncbi:hypothetical protein O6H91_08G105800 [Diphasiastrum complanatum]|uniref:Uncharacterized protein n=1 Tax=Diphasiastrum complanatum TaxID=34168 RepID=A0ACC2D0P1_DIPCM|nr:hypothetical protein O6H91_Y168700 [Diphasiastrum complanatum]KAJ7547831.1 hypothetical protein O6H91_08G105800 [Diphasiastrum complanatum]